MYFDTKALKNKIEHIGQDLEKGKMSTSAWLWLLGGAVTGLVMSCVTLTRKTVKPIVAKMSKLKEDIEDVEEKEDES